MCKNYLVEKLEGLQKRYEIAFDCWMELEGKERDLFFQNTLDIMKAEMYLLKQRIKKGETGIEDKKTELKELKKRYESAADIYINMKDEDERIMFQVNELEPLKAKIYNLKKELKVK